MRHITLRTSDGHSLAADVIDTEDQRGVAVVCHPHPLYGGNRFNPIVEAVFTALPTVGLTTVRFDFRADHDHGVAERLDVLAAIDSIALDGAPVVLAGYSFGAFVALATRDARITALVAIAPPLTEPAPAPGVRSLVLSPEHDQFCPYTRARELTSTWADTTVEAVVGADHFLAGRAADVAARAAAWLSSM